MCNAEFPRLQSLYDKYRPLGFDMVAIQMDPDQNGRVAEWRTKGKYTFPVLLVPPPKGGLAKERDYAGAHYDVWLAPTDLLLDSTHKVIFRHVGSGAAVLEPEIRELLGLPPF